MKKKELKAAFREARAELDRVVEGAKSDAERVVRLGSQLAAARERRGRLAQTNVLLQAEVERLGRVGEDGPVLAAALEDLRKKHSFLYADFQRVVKERDQAKDARDESDRLMANARESQREIDVLRREIAVLKSDRDLWRKLFKDLDERALVVGRGSGPAEVDVVNPYAKQLRTLQSMAQAPADHEVVRESGRCGHCNDRLTASEVQDGRTIHVACMAQENRAERSDSKVTGPLRTGFSAWVGDAPEATTTAGGVT